MVRELTLRQVGGSIGATIPKDLDATEAEVVAVMTALAAGKLSEAELASWMRGRLVRRKR